MERIVVVGGGLAGARLCQELASGGFAGEVLLLGAEEHRPYDRPPLSKELLRPGPESDLAAPELDHAMYSCAALRLGTTATRFHPRFLETSDGPLEWDQLALTVGAVPSRLPGDGSSLVLRTLDDARRVRAGLRPGARVIVVGAGWIGAEVATAAALHGCQVTVLEAGEAPLGVPLGVAAGSHTASWYAEAGVTLRTRTRVLEASDHGVAVNGGEYLSADLVVEGVGVRRELAWLDGSGVDVDGGILTDPGCRTSQRNVYAVGDCASRWSPRASRRFLLEHWDDALHAPTVAARVMLGEQDASYDPVPYVWSEQFGRYVQWVGWREGEATVWRGDPTGRTGWAAGWLDEMGRLTGFLAVDRPRDARQARKLIAAGSPLSPDRLANVAIPVSDARVD